MDTQDVYDVASVFGFTAILLAVMAVTGILHVH